MPSIKSNSYGGRAFSAAAPELWNWIPEYIKKLLLINYLFSVFYFLIDWSVVRCTEIRNAPYKHLFIIIIIIIIIIIDSVGQN